jgi:hypothetical protein
VPDAVHLACNVDCGDFIKKLKGDYLLKRGSPKKEKAVKKKAQPPSGMIKT